MGREIVIVDSLNNERIAINKLFGKDSARISKACYCIMENWLYPYKDCYLPASRPSLPYRKKWYNEHPEEKEKMESSRKEWEEQRDKQFRIVYGIAKHNHLYIKWCGNSSVSRGDEWVINKNGKSIAFLYVC